MCNKINEIRNARIATILAIIFDVDSPVIVDIDNTSIHYAVKDKNKVQKKSISDVIVGTMVYLSKLTDVKTKFRIDSEPEGPMYVLRITTNCKKTLSKISTNDWLDTVMLGYFTYLDLHKEGKI